MIKFTLKKLLNLLNLIVILVLSSFSGNTQAKEIFISPSSNLLKQAAEELSGYLTIMYNAQTFQVVDRVPARGDVIVLVTDPELESEEFEVHSKRNKGKGFILTISGGSPVAVRYGVYKFLEELGCGFYLSHEIIPRLNKELCLTEISFNDTPLVKDRVVFNWHNFLSGCSAWDMVEWKKYIDNASKMRFNGLMTHFYANDPSFTFSHNGVKKMVGYMPNTLTGRQYGTQQVNDVTRMVAGEIFSEPVFGSEASKVPDNERERAAQDFVGGIHRYASSKSMKIWMGFDIDYPLANPPEIMASLPSEATLKIKRNPNKYFGMPWSDITLPVPDSPEGFAYYKSQIRQLFVLYPEVNNLVLWTRTEGSAFLTLRYEEFPDNWKAEFDMMSASNPIINKTDEKITGRFAVAKIYKAVRRALDETDKGDIKLWAGSWRVSWLEQADLFYPSGVGFIPLDYEVDLLSDPDKINIVRQVSRNREILPVVWAHHDDGSFIGSPFIPYPGLQSKIADSGSSGIGIIHWTTKPLDIYFKTTERQIWKMSANDSLEATAEFIANRLVPPEKADKLTTYLISWVKDGPKFGRETRHFFFDRKISDSEFNGIIQKCSQRIRLIDELDENDNRHVRYFKALEEFCIAFYKTQYSYQNALAAFNTGKYNEAIDLLRKCEPESVIRLYAEAAGINGLTKGEQGVVLELNLSWLPHIYSLKQTLRQKEVRYNFGLTNFPDIGVGLLETNYFIDKNKNLWRNYGERETKGVLFYNNMTVNDIEGGEYSEICFSGVKSKDSLLINLRPVASDISPTGLKNPDYFLPGKYKLTLIFNEHEFTEIGDRIFEINIEGSQKKLKSVKESIDIVRLSGRRNKVLYKTFMVILNGKESLRISIKSSKGDCLINGLVFEPLYE